MADFPTKSPGETVLCTFDFTDDVPSGSVLSSPSIALYLVKSGTDSGSSLTFAATQVVGTTVKGLIGGGISGSRYEIRASCSVNDGEVRFIDKILPVNETGPLLL